MSNDRNNCLFWILMEPSSINYIMSPWAYTTIWIWKLNMYFANHHVQEEHSCIYVRLYSHRGGVISFHWGEMGKWQSSIKIWHRCAKAFMQKILAFNPITHTLLKQRQRDGVRQGAPQSVIPNMYEKNKSHITGKWDEADHKRILTTTYFIHTVI